ncbi:MAG TPA: HD domain-containing protein [Rhizomicrobium sp.]|nr:HD domain-containing protein [Rhizomicrobium sp.]
MSEPKRLILAQPIANPTDFECEGERAVLAALKPGTIMMQGDNPALPQMPERPRLLDFYRLRFGKISANHLLQSATLARKAGQPEKVVLACLLHDIANGILIRADHGYWGAQLIAPYVDEEIAWAVQHHQALRFFPDADFDYEYPAAYVKFFGPDYVVPDYLQRAHDTAREHRWYGSARAITLYDLYAFEENVAIDPAEFEDLIGRHFKQPEDGLGFDNSPTAHMWRTMIWPNNFL